MYKLICMSFDGDYQTERAEFETVRQAWNHSEDMGSRWYFYPFHFVVRASGKTVAGAPYMMEYMKGMRVATVAKIFGKTSKRPEMQGVDVDAFAFALSAYHA